MVNIFLSLFYIMNLSRKHIIILIFIVIIYLSLPKIQEDFSNSFQYKCQGGMGKVLTQVSKERGMNKNNEEWDFHFPCTYNTCEIDANLIKISNDEQKLFLIDGCDQVNSKVALWNALVTQYGRKNACEIMPDTYILRNGNDLKLFEHHFNNVKKKNPKCKFVLKNHKQRQEGIKLENKLENILKAKSQGFNLVQDYLEDPYIISGRKINIRYYLLVVCDKNHIYGYVHQNGFMYYTPKFYQPGTLDFKEHITTGYIDRKVYQENPLTIQDFNQHLIKNNTCPKQYFNKVKYLFTLIMKALRSKICKNTRLKNNTIFQLFGADIAPDSDLRPYLVEINKGPDLGPKDERDKKVKLKVQQDIMDIVDDLGYHKLDAPNQFHMIFKAGRF